MTPGEELLVGLAIKSTVLILLAWAAAGLLRKASAALRHLVWAAALGGLALLPALNALLPAWRAPVAPPASSGTAVSAVQVTAGDASQPLRVGQLAWALWGGRRPACGGRLSKPATTACWRRERTRRTTPGNWWPSSAACGLRGNSRKEALSWSADRDWKGV